MGTIVDCYERSIDPRNCVRVLFTVPTATSASTHFMPPLLTAHPSNQSHGAKRRQTRLLDQPQRVEGHHEAGTIVLSALTDVPGVCVAAKHDNLHTPATVSYPVTQLPSYPVRKEPPVTTRESGPAGTRC